MSEQQQQQQQPDALFNVPPERDILLMGPGVSGRVAIAVALVAFSVGTWLGQVL